MIRKKHLLTTVGIALAALTACSSDPLLQLKERTETTIGAQGGAAKSADGKVEIQFPLGALGRDTVIQIETIRNGKVVPGAVDSVIYDLSPDGLTFDHDVFIKIHAAAPKADDVLGIANVDGEYPQVLASSTWNPDLGVVQATLAHFSSYAAVVVYNACAGLDCGDPCTICDPANSACVEPAPTPKACNRSGLCVGASTALNCPVVPDAGIDDTGEAPDTGEPPDSGEPADTGIDDTGVAVCGESFTQNAQPVVDILIVMDNSGSMAEEQANLASSFDVLRSTLEGNNTDFHIGVTTTDADVTFGGEGGAFIGMVTILSTSTPNLATEFAYNVQPGVSGSGIEQGLEASMLALTPPLNPGFLRDNSSLTVIYLSDEQDQSISSTTAYAQFLLGVRDARRLQANTIVGDLPSGCTSATASAAEGTGYEDIRAATNGTFSSICTTDWSNALTDLGGPGYGYLYQFTLSTPAPSVVGVSVDGNAVPNTDWSYDPATGAVSFSESAVPGPGATIFIETGC